MLSLNLGILKLELTIKPELCCGEMNHEPILESVRLLPAVPAKKYNFNSLYLMQWEHRPAAFVCPKYLICVGGGEEAAHFFEACGVNCLIYSEETDPALLMAEVQERFEVYQQLHNEFMMLLVTQKPMHMVLDFCASLMGNYVFLLDAKYNVLEMTAIDGDENAVKDRSKQSRMKEIIEAVAGQIRTRCQADAFADNQLVEFVPPDQFAPEFCFSRFFDGNQCVAILAVVRTETPFYPHSGYFMQYLSNLLQPCMNGRFSPALKTHGFIRKAIGSLIDDMGCNMNDLAENLAAIGWKPKDTYQLVYIRTSISDRRTSQSSGDYHRYENLFPDCIASVNTKHACVIVLVHNPAEEISAQTMNHLRELMANNRMECRISLPFYEFSQLKAHFELVRASLLDMGERRENVSLYRDVMAAHIISEIGMSFPLRALCHIAAVRLQEYDARNGTELLITLEKYLTFNRSIQKAGEELYLHRNTIIYRLKKIEEITGNALNSMPDDLHLLLSCIVLRALDQDEGQ